MEEKWEEYFFNGLINGIDEVPRVKSKNDFNVMKRNCKYMLLRMLIDKYSDDAHVYHKFEVQLDRECRYIKNPADLIELFNRWLYY